MSLHQPARRLVQTARSAAAAAAAPNPALRLLPYTQRRHASWNPFTWGRSKSEPKADPLTAELTRREQQKKMMNRMSDRTAGDSIFEDEIKESEATTNTGVESADAYNPTLVKEHVMRAIDPDPRWRVRWQRKKVMQMVRNGNKMTKEQKLKLVEKDHVFQSDNMETSTKKLVHLAHQIAGKTVEDAITQMRFTKKKTGKQLVYYLELARDEAIAKRGMGLGAATGELLPRPRQIRVKDGTKDGRLIEVTDPTRLYVDQAWVGKGPYRGVRIQYHARGRQSAMWKPATHINFVLKEEKTRIRLHDAKVEKQAKAKPWVHLPNRPITAQRQHYTW